MDASQQHETEAQGRLKVFVSYSRADLAFADQLVLALEDKGFEPLLDRHDIDAAEKWKDRLGALLFSCDTVVFVLSETSAKSEICRWEVAHAASVGKRMIPVTPHAVDGVAPPPELAELNYIPFHSAPAVPGSGFYAGVQKLTHALKVDLPWLRQQTRLSEQAAEWTREKQGDLLLRGVALEEALAWRTRAPKGAQVLTQVRDYIAASETAGETRKAEAQAQIAERETALAQAEAALAQKERADKLARRATLIGGGVAAVLILVAGAMTLIALRSTADLGEARSDVMASAAFEEVADGRHAEALRIALGGDPAAQRGLFERLSANAGYPAAREALIQGYTHTRLLRVFAGQVVATPAGGEGLAIYNTSAFLLPPVPVRSVAFSPNGAKVLIGSELGAKLLDAETGREVRSFPNTLGVSSVAFSPDGRRILIGTNPGISWGDSARSPGGATLFDAESGEALQAIGRGEYVSLVGFGPQGEMLIVANDTVQVWQVGAESASRAVPITEPVNAAALFPDGKRALIGIDSGAVLLDVENGRMERLGEGFTNAVAVASTGAVVLIGGPDGATLWDPATRQLLRPLAGRGIVSAAFSSDGRQVATGHTLDTGENLISVWNVATGRLVQDYGGHEDEISAVALSGGWMLSGSLDGAARLWTTQTPSPEMTTVRDARLTVDWSNEGWDVRGAIAYSPDGRTRLVGIPSGIALVDAESSQSLHLLEERGSESAIVAYSPTGHRVVTSVARESAMAAEQAPGIIKLWDADTGRELRRLERPARMTTAAFAADGRHVLVGSYNGSWLWDTETGNVVQTFETGLATSAAFTPDGTHVLIGMAQNSAALWDVETGRVTQTFGPPRFQVSDVAVSADGAYVLTNTRFGGEIHLWSAATGRVLQTFPTQNIVTGLAFSADGRRVLAGLGDGVRAESWEIDPIIFAPAREQVRVACDRLRSIGMINFTAADRQRFPILRGEPASPCPAARR